MNTTYTGIIALIKSAILGKAVSLPEGFSLVESEKLLRKHSLLPLAYQGAHYCGISKESEIMQRLRDRYFQTLMRSEEQLRAIRQLYAAFDENGIDYLPVKGCILKGMYPKPELRIMGDADILIRTEQYDRIKPIMQQLGFEEKNGAEHELPWVSKALYVELHKSLFPQREEDLWACLGDGWDRAVKGQGNRHDLSVEDAYIYIFTHMTKHFRGSGVGARQLVDLYVYRRAHPEMDEARIGQTMEALHLTQFHNNIMQLLAVWFADAPEDPVTDYITDYVFHNGNWGTEENKLYSEELQRAQKAGGIKNSGWKSLIHVIFMPLRDMKMRYGILYKYPVLLPIFWVVRWFDVLIHKPKNIGKKLGMVREMTDEKVAAHQQAMQYMGLDG